MNQTTFLIKIYLTACIRSPISYLTKRSTLYCSAVDHTQTKNVLIWTYNPWTTQISALKIFLSFPCSSQCCTPNDRHGCARRNQSVRFVHSEFTTEDNTSSLLLSLKVVTAQRPTGDSQATLVVSRAVVRIATSSQKPPSVSSTSSHGSGPQRMSPFRFQAGMIRAGLVPFTLRWPPSFLHIISSGLLAF